MNELIVYSATFYHSFLIFLFVLLRVSAVIVFAPVFSSSSIPAQLKALFCVVLSFALYPVAKPFIHIENISALYLGLTVVKEVVFAALLSLCIHFIFSGIEIGAQLVGFNMGFSIANVVSPEENIQISVLSEFESIFAILVFLIINGHYEYIKAIAYSFKTIPVGGFFLNQSLLEILNRMIDTMFAVAFTVLAPAIIALFITQVVFGLIARTMPQINIMIVAFPLSIAIGFVVLGATFTFAAESLINYYHQAIQYLYAIIKVG